MKKSLMTMSLCSLFTVNASFAASDTPVAAGVALDQGLSGVLELNDQYRIIAGNDGLAFDYMIHRDTIDGLNAPVQWYVGAGGWSEWNHDDDYGLRVPVGVDWVYNHRLKVYGQVHPALEIEHDTQLKLGAAVGVVYSF